jgi:hypothetical protein
MATMDGKSACRVNGYTRRQWNRDNSALLLTVIAIAIEAYLTFVNSR